ncbi:F0F1 ATP synthase subunit B [Arcanobacterium sp. S3PF19]|uniref:F0F1 ATP synthase subunit B n=1 Tax=Arcanobacterium sp. S3PF19 TaxID=1219585 RepID=UPI00050F189A|nr:F0F1 ATP synthase subunit B [Arcanobacterium sp. S3PF19]KGF06255.1 ATP synthase F0F1 subunit B [Arcanobacterium sp. S3PF19]
MLNTTAILAAGEGGHGHNILLPSLPDLIWGTVAFVVVAAVIYKFAWPTFVQMLDERREKIEKGINAARAEQTRIAAERETLAGETAQARREAAEIREQARDNAKSIVADAQQKARVQADSMVHTAKERIEADTASATRALRGDVGLLATELAGKIVGEAVADKDLAARVIDRFLDELENTLVTGKATREN